MCGEHADPSRYTLSGQGSSPRVRGAWLTPESAANIDGIIPACAGSIEFEMLSPSTTRDHPRVCGEHRRTGYL